MNSEHSFATTDINTLLRDSFIEFSSISVVLGRLTVNPSEITLVEYGKPVKRFQSEEDIIIYFKKEIHEHSRSM